MRSMRPQRTGNPHAWRPRVLLFAAWLVGLAAGRAAEDDSDGPARFHSVKAWRGSITATARPDPTIVALHDRMWREGGVGARWTFQYGASVQVELLLTEYESDPSVWTGKVMGSSYNASYHYFTHVPNTYKNPQEWLKGYGESEWSFSAAGALDFSGDPRVELQFHRQRGWSVRIASGRAGTEVRSNFYGYIPPPELQDKRHDTVIAPTHTTRRETRAAKGLGMGSTGNLPYPKQGLILAGKGTKTGSFPLIGDVGFTPAVIWDYSVNLAPTTLEELRLEIEEPAAYATWRPETTPRAEPGKPLEVTARVVTPDGRKPQTRVESFEWVLEGTSREPGVTMNYPVASSDGRPDLELDAAGAMFVLSADKQTMQRAVRDGFSDTVKVVPFDWGGWSTLQVRAKLSDGRELTGKLKGGNEFGLRIPKRAPDSHIADGWKRDKGVWGADASDDDAAPVGDGTKGDGLTLYEEYRGFYENGERLEGDPKTKDFFIRLKQAGVALSGIGKFQRITKLKVHFEFRSDEFPSTRVINLNHAQGARLGPQHGVVVQVDAARSGSAIANGGPGNPKKITSVDLMGDVGAIAAENPGWVASTVAHELGHSVNLYHHGESDPGKVVWFIDEGKIYELRSGTATPTEIQVLDEQFGDVGGDLATEIGAYHKELEARHAANKPLSDAERKMLPAKSAIIVSLGGDQGQHSGFDNCVMRYDSAQAYVFRLQPNVRFWKFEEPVGHALCRSQAGSGVNQAGRTPQDRYGIAAHGRGDCLHQILVNDSVDAPSRGAVQHTR